MYEDFAAVYDTIMRGVPYQKWLKRIDGWIEAYGVSEKRGAGEDEKNLVLDLACGTGTFTEMLADLGYDTIGIDRSPAMLCVATEKKNRFGSLTLYLCQEMQAMELFGTVGTIVCLFDSLNYLLAEDELLTTFRLVRNYLYPGGLFIFDFNTVHRFRDVLGEATMVESLDSCTFIWENYYHHDEEINEAYLTFFIKEKDGRFRKCQEIHQQRGYEPEQMKHWLELAGLELVLAIDDDTEGAPCAESERVFAVARSPT
jgi:SAM-dependent methyltransferase